MPIPPDRSTRFPNLTSCLPLTPAIFNTNNIINSQNSSNNNSRCQSPPSSQPSSPSHSVKRGGGGGDLFGSKGFDKALPRFSSELCAADSSLRRSKRILQRVEAHSSVLTTLAKQVQRGLRAPVRSSNISAGSEPQQLMRALSCLHEEEDNAAQKQKHVAHYNLSRLAMLALNTKDDDIDSLEISPRDAFSSKSAVINAGSLSKANSVMLRMGLNYSLPHLNPHDLIPPQPSWIRFQNSRKTPHSPNRHHPQSSPFGSDSDNEEAAAHRRRSRPLATFITAPHEATPTGYNVPSNNKSNVVIGRHDDGSGSLLISSSPSSSTTFTHMISFRSAHLHREDVKERRKMLKEERRTALTENQLRQERLTKIALHMIATKGQTETNAMRGAMWLTVINVVLNSLFDAPKQRRLRRMFQLFFLPMWRRYHVRREKKAGRMFLNAYGLRRMVLPSPDTLRATGALFVDWPTANLLSFSKKLRPAVYLKGEYICHQGDSSDRFYILAMGKLSVIVRSSAGEHKKARGKLNGHTVACLSAVTYVGEYGVYADEPRSATLHCDTLCCCWAIGKDAFTFELSKLPIASFDRIRNHFQISMEKIYQVRPAQLVSTILFLNWDLDILENVCKKLEPVLMAENTVVMQEGIANSCIYFISRGKCEVKIAPLQTSTGLKEFPTQLLVSGDHFGARPCLFLETHHATVRSLTTFQGWRLPKKTLMDFMLQRPDLLIQCKIRLNRAFEKLLPKIPFDQFEQCTQLFGSSSGFPRSLIERMYGCLQPLVVEACAEIARSGSVINNLYFLVKGSATYSNRKFYKGSVIGADQLLLGVNIWNSSVITIERCDCWSLPIVTMMPILERAAGFRSCSQAVLNLLALCSKAVGNR